MGSGAASAAPARARRSACSSCCTATLLWPDGEGSGAPIVRTERPGAPLGGGAAWRASGWKTGRMEQSTDLAALVPDWLDWAATASALGVTVGKVRTMIRDHELAAAVPSPGAGQQIPADFIQDGQVVKGLPGLLTILHDG